MTWREWPQGAESIDAPGDRDICPVCASTLRPVEVLYTSKPHYYNPESRTVYVAICPKCRTQYLRDKPAESVTISPDAEYITDLEERVRILEETLSRLVVLSQQQPQKQQDTQTEQNDAQDFTRKYRYLL